jgi:hypothetical protein
MSERIHVATRKGVFTLGRAPASSNGTPWRITGTAFLGDTAIMLLPDPRDGTLYVALHHGHFGSKMHRSRDGGVRWEECAVPVYPKQPEGSPPEVHPFTQKPVPWTLDRVWSLEPGNPDQRGVLWCGTLPGGLFRSADGGSSWEMVRSLWDHPKRREWFGGGADLPGIHSVLVDPRDGRLVKVGVSCGGVWATTDGGETWECQAKGMRAEYMPPDKQYEPNAQDPHRVVHCPSNPDYLWAQHHNGVFRSTDGAASWQELENVAVSRFGFAVAVHPREPDTAWLIPGIKDERRIPVDGKVVVTRTRDGGKSYDVLRHGLPQEHAYDLVFRHAFDVDETGERLAFGSTTGSLWVSDDAGDSWHCVSNHLPPVYCVRFAR